MPPAIRNSKCTRTSTTHTRTSAGKSANERKLGQFYTVTNPFAHPAFRRWARTADLPQARILEPFAGCNSLIAHLHSMNLCKDYAAYDIAPAARDVRKRDTLAKFPRGFDVCITNPPWLAKNSATGRGLAFPKTHYDDLYKYALEKCLLHCAHLAVLVPESFIRSRARNAALHTRLHTFISLTTPIFADTAHPVGLALFTPQAVADTMVYSGKHRVGRLSAIERCRPQPCESRQVVFNDPDGTIGLIAVDNTYGDSIRFCRRNELADYPVIDSCRYMTVLSVNARVRIDRLNEILAKFRFDTCDVLMTPYRGLRKDGKYRRRLDWQLARGIVANAAS